MQQLSVSARYCIYRETNAERRCVHTHTTRQQPNHAYSIWMKNHIFVSVFVARNLRRRVTYTVSLIFILQPTYCKPHARSDSTHPLASTVHKPHSFVCPLAETWRPRSRNRSTTRGHGGRPPCEYGSSHSPSCY